MDIFADFEYQMIQPESVLADFVEVFWMLHNPSENEHKIVLIPDGRIDLIFCRSSEGPFRTVLKGIDTKPSEVIFLPETTYFAVSFRLLAVEYFLNLSIADLINGGKLLSTDFGLLLEDMDDFDIFCKKLSAVIKAGLSTDIDSRKRKLFQLIYTSKGAMPVAELADQVYWSSRQINRYFNQRFGISLKAYSSILRFLASLRHIKDGQLFPEQNFSDQSHFIKEVKRLSGVSPGTLSKNENDRFILLSTWPKK